MIYIFDTNSIRTLKNYYPQQFVSLWENIDTYIQAGKILSVREVRQELETQDITKHLQEWIKENRHIFTKPDAKETEFVAKIFQVKHFQPLVSKGNILRGRHSADPFIIACAQVRNAYVVTEERHKPNASKIPNVCHHFDVACTNLQGFMEKEGWRF